MGLGGFFEYARARQAVHLRRLQGDSFPWSSDPILRNYRFCNVFREDDRTTQWFRENLRDPVRADPLKSLTATVAFRWFNRIATGEKIKDVLLGKWNSAEVRAQLSRAARPIFTSAYVIRSEPGLSKLDSIVNCINRIVVEFREHPVCWSSMQECHAWLLQFPMMGRFIAYEVVTDLRHTCVLAGASDVHTWASAGPGAARGLSWVEYGDSAHKMAYATEKAQLVMNKKMQELLHASTDPANWPHEQSWEMREVEHTLCEYDKYCRVKYDGKRLKRRFRC